jgi:hypothetical protein
MFLSSDEGKEIPTLLGLLERANRNHWTRDATEYMSNSPHQRTETDSVLETLFFSC